MSLPNALGGSPLTRGRSHDNEKRRSLFEAQDKVDQQREALIANLKGKITLRADLSPLFTLHWRLQSARLPEY